MMFLLKCVEVRIMLKAVRRVFQGKHASATYVSLLEYYYTSLSKVFLF